MNNQSQKSFAEFLVITMAVCLLIVSHATAQDIKPNVEIGGGDGKALVGNTSKHSSDDKKVLEETTPFKGMSFKERGNKTVGPFSVPAGELTLRIRHVSSRINAYFSVNQKVDSNGDSEYCGAGDPWCNGVYATAAGYGEKLNVDVTKTLKLKSPSKVKLVVEADGKWEIDVISIGTVLPSSSSHPKEETALISDELEEEKESSDSQEDDQLDGHWTIRWQEDGASDGSLNIRHIDKVNHIGSYNPKDNGRLFMKLNSGQIEGYWVENDSNHECRQPYKGSRYWGRIQLKDTGGGKSFSGTWWYCNESKPYTLLFVKIKEKILEDGTKVTTYVDKEGNNVTLFSDGRKITQSGEGVNFLSVQELPDGTKITESGVKGLLHKFVRELPDGTKITQENHGPYGLVIVTERPDGTKITRKRDGITEEKPDGTKVTEYYDRKRAVLKKTELKDGTIIEERSDGEKVTTLTNGARIVDNPNVRGGIKRIINDQKGTLIYIYNDGTRKVEKHGVVTPRHDGMAK